MESSMFSMTGQVVIITGASSGLGAHFAKVLANAGASVAVCARRTEKLNNLVDEIVSSGGRAKAFEMDVTNESSVINALEAIEANLGNVSVLINNAGVADSKRLVNVSDSDWDYIMDTNLKAAWRVAKYVSQAMIKNGTKGSIVNIASILGIGISLGDSAYAISKAGVVHLTKSLALELANKGIRVNALCPGYFETEMTEGFFATEKGKAYINSITPKRLGKLEELSGPILLLCSNAGSFMNGVTMPVDGGHLIHSI